MPSSSLILGLRTTLVFLSSFSLSFAAPQNLALRQATTPAYTYTLDQQYSGSAFFDNFNFYDDSDPTHGFVTYGNRAYAQANGLIGFDGTYAVMKVDSKTNLGKGRNYYRNNGNSDYYSTNGVGRKSVRIEGAYSFTHGLLIADIGQLPGGICGTWPAFWTLGQSDWPTDGEIDIIEGANAQGGNVMSLHTGNPSNINGDSDSFSGSIIATDCDVNLSSSDPNYAGCEIEDGDAGSYGSYTGGVWAMQWTSDRIKMWYWPYGSVPQDVTNGTPKPGTAAWGTPRSSFAPPENLRVDQNFNSHRVIFDTTFCGDLGDSTWASTGCAARTGYASCADYVANTPSAFANAQWKIKYVKIFKEGPALVTTTTSSRTTSTTRQQSSSTSTTVALTSPVTTVTTTTTRTNSVANTSPSSSTTTIDTSIRTFPTNTESIKPTLLSSTTLSNLFTTSTTTLSFDTRTVDTSLISPTLISLTTTSDTTSSDTNLVSATLISTETSYDTTYTSVVSVSPTLIITATSGDATSTEVVSVSPTLISTSELSASVSGVTWVTWSSTTTEAQEQVWSTWSSTTSTSASPEALQTWSSDGFESDIQPHGGESNGIQQHHEEPSATIKQGGGFYPGRPGHGDGSDEWVTTTVIDVTTVPCSTAPGYEVRTTTYVTMIPNLPADSKTWQEWSDNNAGSPGPVTGTEDWNTWVPTEPTSKKIIVEPSAASVSWAPNTFSSINKAGSASPTWVSWQPQKSSNTLSSVWPAWTGAKSGIPVISVTVHPVPVATNSDVGNSWASASVPADSTDEAPAPAIATWNGWNNVATPSGDVKPYKGSATSVTADARVLTALALAILGAMFVL